MGHPLSEYEAFVDELEKQASISRLLTRLGKSPLGKGMASKARSVGEFFKGQHQGLSDATQRVMHPVEGMRKGWKEMGGWTGKGKVTKYLPIGEKSLTLGIPAAALTMGKSQPASPTGEGGAAERWLANIGGAAGGVLGGGLGFVPAVGMFTAGEVAGGRLGRVIDRLRSGGTVDQALNAPSPTEATSQINRIRRYYG